LVALAARLGGAAVELHGVGGGHLGSLAPGMRLLPRLAESLVDGGIIKAEHPGARGGAGEARLFLLLGEPGDGVGLLALELLEVAEALRQAADAFDDALERTC